MGSFIVSLHSRVRPAFIFAARGADCRGLRREKRKLARCGQGAGVVFVGREVVSKTQPLWVGT